MTDSEKQTSLLPNGINYDHKKYINLILGVSPSGAGYTVSMG
jgi:hypothetical protein